MVAGEGTVRLRGELTVLGKSLTFLSRDGKTGGPFYVHGQAPQGYTHRGQLLGAGIGPGSNSQFIAVDRYTANGRWSVFLRRVRFDDDAFYDRFVPGSVTFAFEFHDAEFTVGGSVFRFLGDFDVGAGLELSRRLNWYFERGNHVTNVNGKLTVRWKR